MKRSPKVRFDRRWAALTATLACAILPVPARACRIYVPLRIEDVRFAEIVLVGRIANYRVIRDMEFRRKMLSSPHLRPGDRHYYEDGTSLLPDYARFDIEVDEVLKGDAPKRLRVTWDNSTFGEPATMPPGPYLIALRRPGSPMPPLRGPSATIMPNREPDSLTMLQAPCSSPFLFESGSDQARTIRRMMRARRD